jgi:hypothetical protein
MLTRGMFIKHDKFMDVCIRIDKSPIKLPDGRYVVRGTFWNMAFVDSYSLRIKFIRKLTVEDIRNNWTATLAGENDTCLRYNKWVRL